MTQSQIASLSLKLIGIYSIIEAVPFLESLTEVFAWRGSEITRIQGGPFDSDFLLIGTLLAFFLQLVIGFSLLFFSGPFSHKMVASEEAIAQAH